MILGIVTYLWTWSG